MDKPDILKPPSEEEVSAWAMIKGDDVFREQIAVAQGIVRGTLVFGKTDSVRFKEFLCEMGWLSKEYFAIQMTSETTIQEWLRDNNDYIGIGNSVRPKPSIEVRKQAIVKWLVSRHPQIQEVTKHCLRLEFTTEETFKAVVRWCKHEGILNR